MMTKLRLLILLLFGLCIRPHVTTAQHWTRHTIDSSYQGADGVRFADFNSDGHPDLVTGWEESGLVRLYLHPGKATVYEPWPSVTLAKAKSPEDAVPCDVDNDGRIDVVSCHEGKKRQVLVHWNDVQAPASAAALLRPNNWQTERFAQIDGQQWMFALPLGVIDGKVCLVVGSKGDNASITLLVSPPNDLRRLHRWQAIRLRDAGWIMSLRAVDMNNDRRTDIVFSDRKGPNRVAAWLQQPATLDSPWIEHEIAGKGQEVMFLTATQERCLIAVRNGQYLDCRRADRAWIVSRHSNPLSMTMGKAIEALAPKRLVMTLNTVFERENGKPVGRPGIWVQDKSQTWQPIDPTTKTKFDRIELLDLDEDGDLDIITCEERRNLGIVWYENPK